MFNGKITIFNGKITIFNGFSMFQSPPPSKLTMWKPIVKTDHFLVMSSPTSQHQHQSLGTETPRGSNAVDDEKCNPQTKSGEFLSGNYIWSTEWKLHIYVEIHGKIWKRYMEIILMIVALLCKSWKLRETIWWKLWGIVKLYYRPAPARPQDKHQLLELFKVTVTAELSIAAPNRTVGNLEMWTKCYSKSSKPPGGIGKYMLLH